MFKTQKTQFTFVWKLRDATLEFRKFLEFDDKNWTFVSLSGITFLYRE